ncbi:MAG: transcriptional regulator [SAR202 cluster bacterium Casp-Chloro-G4]|nr:P-II family nitrogen regulator [Chloroflexota bacterium]MDA1227099.1 P-II family nitrogen regulator [Chloroflexota bacterium]PKB61828.1 MAG: transcriptional regulator [SAR202 cluster bacterium Casp-Chloro-G4]
MNKIEAIIRPDKFETVKSALTEAGYVGMNTVNVTGRGNQRGVIHTGRGAQAIEIDMLPKIKVELVVKTEDTDKVCNIIMDAARTGNIGDGKIFVSPISAVYRVRTGERDDEAI